MTDAPKPTPRRLPETPAELLGPTIRETVSVGGRSFSISRPDAVDRFVNHPELGAPRAADEYKPYWASLWPAARMLAEVVLRETWPHQPATALEIGCGLGLPGIAALAKGLRVIFSDYDATALRFAADNARANGFTDFSLLHMDWHWPPRNLQVPLLLASEVLYEADMTATLCNLIKQLLASDGLCLLIDREHVAQNVLADGFKSAGLAFTTEPVETIQPDRHTKGTLYRINHS